MKGPAPVFLARNSYRLRRVADAARVLPVLGFVLLILPVMWQGGRTAQGIIFLFSVWLGLIIAAALLARPLDANRDQSGQDAAQGQSDGSL